MRRGVSSRVAEVAALRAVCHASGGGGVCHLLASCYAAGNKRACERAPGGRRQAGVARCYKVEGGAACNEYSRAGRRVSVCREGIVCRRKVGRRDALRSALPPAARRLQACAMPAAVASASNQQPFILPMRTGAQPRRAFCLLPFFVAGGRENSS